MRLPDARIFGEIGGISPEDWDRLQDDLPLFDKAVLSGTTIIIEHEGWGLDHVDEFVKAAAALMDPAAYGYLDHIDNEKGLVHRYVIESGTLRSRTVGINEVLEQSKL